MGTIQTTATVGDLDKITGLQSTAGEIDEAKAKIDAVEPRVTIVEDAISKNTTDIETKAQLNIGTNRFNINDADVVIGSYINGSNGELASNSSYNTSGFIKVDGGIEYTMSYKHNIAWYDETKQFISGDTGTNKTQTAPTYAKFVRCTILASQFNNFSINIGTVLATYSEYSATLDKSSFGAGTIESKSIANHAVSVDKTTFFIIGKNKFNKSTAKIGYYNALDGRSLPNSSYDHSELIPVEEGMSYSCNPARFVTLYNADKLPVAGGFEVVSNFIVPTGVKFVVVTFYHTYLEIFQLEKAELPTEFKPFGYELYDIVDGVPISLYQEQESTTPVITISPVQYIPVGKEISLYTENVTKQYQNYKSRVSIEFDDGKQTSPSTKHTPSVVGVLNGELKLANENYTTSISREFSIIKTDATDTTAVDIQNIGDSYTGRMTWANVINSTSAADNITFSGMRDSNSSSPQILCEGHSGWTLNNYFTVDSSGGYSPFMQPTNAGYLYYGRTSFWIDANSPAPSSAAGFYYTVRVGYDSSTGLKISPNVGDIMSDSLDSYIHWNGTSWESIAIEVFGDFTLSYSKYRIAWSIPQPDIVNVLLGTNDFAHITESTFATAYTNFKTLYDILIANILADTPTAKVVIGIPVSSGRQGEHGTTLTERRKNTYFMLAEALVSDYAGREAEGIYLLDYHSNVDRVYGFSNTYEKPFSDYSGALTSSNYKTDVVHLGADGFKQMGNIYMGLMQYLRGI